MSDNPPPGWYPDGSGKTRWWDGEQWTEHFAPPPPPANGGGEEGPTIATPSSPPTSAEFSAGPIRPEYPAAVEEAKTVRPWYKKKRFIIPGALLLLVIIFALLPAPTETGDSNQTTSEEGSTSGESNSGPDDQDRSSYEAIKPRKFKLFVKDPDAHAGERYILFGNITQFDAATGDDAFLADSGPKKQSDPFAYLESIWATADDPGILADVVQGDVVKMFVEVEGSYSYDTQIGGNTTVPSVKVNIIKVIGSSD